MRVGDVGGGGCVAITAAEAARGSGGDGGRASVIVSPEDGADGGVGRVTGGVTAGVGASGYGLRAEEGRGLEPHRELVGADAVVFNCVRSEIKKIAGSTGEARSTGKGGGGTSRSTKHIRGP